MLASLAVAAPADELEKTCTEAHDAGIRTARGWCRYGRAQMALARLTHGAQPDRAAEAVLRALDAHLLAVDQEPLQESYLELTALYRLLDREAAVHELLGKLAGRQLSTLDGVPGRMADNQFFIEAQLAADGTFGQPFFDALTVRWHRRLGVRTAPATT